MCAPVLTIATLVSQDGWPALHWASDSGHTRVATYLLSHGADVHAVAKVGRFTVL